MMACGSSEVPTYFEARFRADVQVGSDEDLFSISLGALPGKRYCVTKLSELNLVVKLFESEKDKSEVEMVASLVKSMLAAAGGGGLGRRAVGVPRAQDSCALQRAQGSIRELEG